MSGFAPGSLVVVRDEEWIVRSATPTEHSGTRLEVAGVSGLVRDQEAVFFTGLEQPGSVQALDPRQTRLVPDSSPHLRRSRLWLESLLRRNPLPVTDRTIAVGHRGLLDQMTFQLRPAEQAMRNLRPRILVGDAVGLGKTLEIGIAISELARRGRAERVLVVTPRAVLEQFQHEMWTRFAFPLVRLDSEGIQKVRRTLPASRNPFSYYRRVICSIDTLKNPARYRHHLENQRWDVVVIDECHNLINTGTQANQLARLLARQTDALILASATPHNGVPESFAELVHLLDPAAITDPKHYTAADIQHLYLRRHRNSADVKVDVADKWKARQDPIVVPVDPTPAEGEVLDELKQTWLHPDSGRAPTSGRGRTLFPWTLFKAFLSSPQALRSTIQRRAKNLEDSAEPNATAERAALARLDDLAAKVEDTGFSKLEALETYLTDIGVGPASPTRTVVFSERIDTLRMLHTKLASDMGFKPNQIATLHAQLPDDDLQQVVRDFALTTSPVRVLLASDMASEGLNLHRQCHHLVHFDLPWSLIRIQQRNGRIDRYMQLHQPQIAALALTSDDAAVDSDLRVLTRLLQKENAANQALGDAGALLNLYDEAIEEETVLKRLQSGLQIDEVVPDPDPAALNPFSALMTTGGEHANDPEPAVAAPRTLFDDDDNFLAEALEELTTADHASAKRYDLAREKDEDLIAFNTPADLRARLQDLPSGYLRDQGVADRIRVTASRRYAEERLSAALRTEETTWPDVSFLAPLHPVLDWAAGRALARLGRNEAPVLSGNVESPVFLTQAVYSNTLGQPVVSRWGAVSGLPNSPDVHDLIPVLDAAGVREHAVSTGRVAESSLAELHRLIEPALDAATKDLTSLRGEQEDALVDRLERERSKVHRWQQLALDVVDQAGVTAVSKRRRAAINDDADSLTRLIDNLAPSGNPLVRIIGVIVPKEQ